MNELHVLAAEAFRGEAVDPQAALFSLDNAEKRLAELFHDMRR